MCNKRTKLKSHTRQARASLGMTLVELLIVIAVISIIFAIGAIQGRRALNNSQEGASIKAVQQSVWQAATAASSRGRETTLNLEGRNIVIRLDGSNDEIRRFELADGVSTNLPTGEFLRFLPPGEISQASYDALTQPITITTSKGTYALSLSLIGETRVETN